MQKQRVAIVTVTIVIALAVGGLFGKLWAQKGSNLMQNLQLFERVVNIVLTNYVEKVEPGKLVTDGIRGMLESLDPYTEYLDETDFKDLKVRTEGQFGGIGIHIGVVDERLTVISPIEGTPAERAGIRGGDRIAEIDGKSTEGFTSDDAVKVLRGEPGSKVKLGIARPGVKELVPFDLTREIINIKAVPYSGMVAGDVGYMRLADFSKTASRELARALDSLFDAGAKKIIFDLRSNGGGLLTEGQDVSDLFLPPGKLIVKTQGRVPGSEHQYESETEDKHADFPLVVLVDRGSASAAEIVAGALQDWERGLILGDTTFGKGSVQTIHQLGPEVAVKVTTAYWYTPSGRCINRRHDRNGAVLADSTKKDDKVYYTLGKLHRPMYGGGAIVPDYYLNYEKLTPFEIRINRDAFFDFAVEYTGEHKSVDASFTADSGVVEQFRTYLRTTKKLDFKDAEFDSDRTYMAGEIEREVAGKLLGMRGEYEVRLRRDPQVRKAIDLLGSARSNEQLIKGVKP